MNYFNLKQDKQVKSIRAAHMSADLSQVIQMNPAISEKKPSVTNMSEVQRPSQQLELKLSQTIEESQRKAANILRQRQQEQLILH